MKNKNVTIEIPEIVCTWYKESDRTFHMKFADGSENFCRVHEDDEMDITVGFKICLCKKISKKLYKNEKQSLNELAEKYFRSGKKKKTVENNKKENTVEEQKVECILSKDEVKNEIKEKIKESEVVEEVNLKDETSDETKENAEEEILSMCEVDISVLSDEEILDLIDKCEFEPCEENLNSIKNGEYKILSDETKTHFEIVEVEKVAIKFSISYMEEDGRMASIEVNSEEEAKKYNEWLKSQFGFEGEIKAIYE